MSDHTHTAKKQTVQLHKDFSKRGITNCRNQLRKYTKLKFNTGISSIVWDIYNSWKNKQWAEACTSVAMIWQEKGLVTLLIWIAYLIAHFTTMKHNKATPLTRDQKCTYESTWSPWILQCIFILGHRAPCCDLDELLLASNSDEFAFNNVGGSSRRIGV